jgi:hypothetical protein
MAAFWSHDFFPTFQRFSAAGTKPQEQASEYMKKTPRRRIMVTSSLNKISKDQLGNRVVVRGGGKGSQRDVVYLG